MLWRWSECSSPYTFKQVIFWDVTRAALGHWWNVIDTRTSEIQEYGLQTVDDAAIRAAQLNREAHGHSVRVG